MIVCSGLGDAAAERCFSDRGVAGFLHKPFTIDQLGHMVAVGLRPRA